MVMQPVQHAGSLQECVEGGEDDDSALLYTGVAQEVG
jgi:hypothetical protein